MDKLLKYLMLLLVTIISMTITSCGGDEDEPNVPPTIEHAWDQVGTQTSNSQIDIAIGWHITIYFKFTENFSKLIVSTNNSSNNVRIVPLGQVESIQDISKIPSNGWINLYSETTKELNLYDKSAFIVEASYRGVIKYCRILFNVSSR